ncbi:hypothetical protein [Mycobacterium sp. OTB74]|uniref:hypothetical protein n=1 Tax=Mycobacterium sp. OTB74 TaxID=1853452 RepID=UPI002475CFE6|nr:hypothetical protein [Mycobacterium sp. OTB74]MDH6243822.1 hypothetical protein [Mycobacterium sp. OTB74]
MRLTRVVRAQIVDESTLIGVRLGWLIGAEAFLLAAYATVLTVTGQTAGSPLKTFATESLWLYSKLPIAGFVLSLLMGMSIWSGVWSMGKLRRDYKDTGELKKVQKKFAVPDITVGSLLYLGGVSAPIFLPPVSMAGWAWVFFAGR